MKNITLSAPAELIEAARKNAANKGTTLNSEFRAWLASQSVDRNQRASRYADLLKKLSNANSGRKFSREEMNER
jgi:hypothetical protein